MTNKILTVAAAILLTALPALADVKHDAKISFKIIEAERMELAEAMVQPAPNQIEKFRKTYVKYRTKIVELNAQTLKLIDDYANSSASLTDEQALEMLRRATDIEIARVEARKKCVKKLQSVLIPKQVVRFLQIENKMDAEVLFEMALEIPLDS